jgi:hypothetical protein
MHEEILGHNGEHADMYHPQSQNYGKQKAMPTQREDKRSLKRFFCAFMAMVRLLLLVSGCVLKEAP